MNELTKINLGRQAYTISADAYHQLRQYIDAISKKLNDDEVLNEIEVRMAELLTERGINSDKVILPKDVEFLKSQLGSPADFGDSDDDQKPAATEPKRLFRDVDNGMIAGVAAGLAKYFGLDPLLIRIGFVIIVLVTFGWGVLLYILLWLLVPQAKTPSERLQMVGKPVTVQGLKQVVEQADVKGAAQRVNQTLAGPINGIFRFFLKVIGIGFVAFGLAGILGLITGETYFLANSSRWAQNNIFPIGLRQHVLLHMAVSVVALIAVFIILFGIAIYRRKWPIKAWVTGVLFGLTLIGIVVTASLTATVEPDIRHAYQTNTHTTIRTLQPFTTINSLKGDQYDFNYVTSGKYMVAFTYYGHPNLNEIRTTVTNGTLTIDQSNFDWDRQSNCPIICFPRSYELSITIYAPNAQQLQTPPPIPMWPGDKLTPQDFKP